MSGRDTDMLASLIGQAEGDGADLLLIRAIIEEATSIGAERAMLHLGLADPSAGDDVRALRSLLQGWRDAKRAVGQVVLAWLARICVALLLLGLALASGQMPWGRA
jgi:hypothetical protein